MRSSTSRPGLSRSGPGWRGVVFRRSDRLSDLQLLTIVVPALCAGLYETLRHSVLAPADLPFDLGTPVAAGLVLAISYAFARVSFGIIRRTEARLRTRNRELEALTRRVERLAVLEERERLAREIHDSVAQGLASLLVRLDVVEALAERGRVAEVSGEARALRVAGSEVYSDVREAIAELRSRPEPGPLGLSRALADYVVQFGDRTGIDATFECGVLAGSVEDLAPTAEVQLLRVVQEALTNVRKHAAATLVEVRFWREPDGWHILVQDNGVGFDPAATSATTGGARVGITIMRERAESVGGSLRVSSRRGEGTTMHACVPLSSHRPAVAARLEGLRGTPATAAS